MDRIVNAFCSSRFRTGLMLLLAVIISLSLFGWWHTVKPMPKGLSMQGAPHRQTAEHVRFIYDLTTVDDKGDIVRYQQIFPTLFKLIGNAEHYILLDFFLFNDQPGKQASTSARLAGDLAEHLIKRKRARPEIVIDVITDPINSAYQSAPAATLDRLRAAGINVIVTNLTPLRDSNPIYSLWWRLLLRWIPDYGSYLPHPFAADGDNVSIASWLRLANFKANHRKIAVIDNNGEYTSLVTSANPHGGSSNHSNVALLIDGLETAQDLYRSEQAVANLSGETLETFPNVQTQPTEEESPGLQVQSVTEGAIKTAILGRLERSGAGDSIKMAMFYLADRQIVTALVEASKRGAEIEIILDPNRDAFGYEKNEVPNRPVAAELRDSSREAIKIRWYQTHGEQFHSKMLLFEPKDGPTTLILGSANLTRRNIADYNLETDLVVSGPGNSRPLVEAIRYFDRIWHNRDHPFTAPYEKFADPSRLKYLQYRFQEGSGLGTF